MYALETVLCEFLGLSIDVQPDGSRRDTTLSIRDRNECIAFPDDLLGLPDDEWLTAQSLDKVRIEKVSLGDTATVSLFGQHGAPRPGELWVPFDVFGTAFFFLTRYEEQIRPAKDQFGRPLLDDLPVSRALLDRAIVNEYVEGLWQLMSAVWPGLERKTHDYRFAPSHDVDEFSLKGRSLVSVGMSLGADLFQRHEPLLAARRASAYIATRLTSREVAWDPYLTFDYLMDVSERNAVRSAFYFVTHRRNAAFDPRYDIRDPVVGSVIQRIAARGHEIGLHGSFDSSTIADAFTAELQTLRDVCAGQGVRQPSWGARQHYLRLAIPGSWRAMSDAGLVYDASLGFAAAPGFRAGCCYEFPVWDTEARKALPLRQRPLIAMDVSLLNYQHKRIDEAAAAILSLAATVKRFKGVMSLLWHNHQLPSTRSRSIYSKLVESVV